MRLTFIAISLLFWNISAQAQLVINEVCSKNESVILDPGGFSPDFIEILNTSNESVYLDGFFLSDKSDDVFQWGLPDIELESGELILIWCEGDISSEFHTSFKLDSDGESLFLTNEDGSLLDQITIPPLRTNDSYGRALDTGGWGYFDIATPGNENGTVQYEGYTQPPVYSLGQGFYPEPFSIQIEGAGADVFFTIGGESPNESGIAYNAPISIDSTQVVKAIARSQGYLPSEVISKTYFVDVDKYLPVISLSTEPEDLWGQDSGIYVMGLDSDTVWPYFGANYWDGRQIPVHVEFFKDNILQFEQAADMRIHGGKSARNKAQKPLRIIGRKEYGDKYFHHKLIDQKPLHQFKKFVLRNSGGDFNEVHFRDCWIHQMTLDAGLNVDVNGCEPAVVYLNGEYWGIQNIREKVDKYYCRFNGGYDEDVTYTLLEEDTIVLEGNRVEFNEMLQFFMDMDLADPDLFAQAESMLDVESMSDYIIVETFWNNTDWPANNQKYWKPNIDGGKWRFVLFDTDVSLNSVGYVTEETNNLGRIIDDFQHIELVALWSNLMENPEYKRYFINRYADLLNTCYRPEFLEEELIDFLLRMEPEMANHFNKWGNTIGWWWFYHINPRARVFVQERPQFARTQVNSVFKLAGIYNLNIESWPQGAGTFELNTLDLEDPNWEGQYYRQVAIDLAANPKEGFRFSHWRTDAGEKILGNQLNMAFDEDTRITAVYVAEKEFSLSVKPNPNQGSFSIDFLNSTFSKSQLEVLDAQGRLVYRRELGLLAPGVHAQEMDLELAQGMYHLVLARGRQREVSKFVVY